MAKKNFKTGDPALRFIEIAPQEQDTQDTGKTYDTQNTHTKQYTDNTQEQLPLTPDMPVKKRQDKGETKSKRLNLLIQPSLIDDVKKIAYMQKVSVNELICQVMQLFGE